MTTVKVADCIAGFIYGFTEHDHTAEMEQCFHDTPEFEADVCDAYVDIVSKDNQKALEGI